MFLDCGLGFGASLYICLLKRVKTSSIQSDGWL